MDPERTREADLADLVGPVVGRPAPDAAAPDTTEPAQGVSILVVDDREQIAILVTRLLERAGHRVRTATTVAGALALASRPDRLDLLVTDVVLDGGSGPELASVLRIGRPGLRVLYMSGYTDRVCEAQHERDGGATFLPKPFTDAELRGAVATALAARSST